MRERTPDLRKMPTASGADRTRQPMALRIQRGSGRRPQLVQPSGAPNTRRRRLEALQSPSALGRGGDLGGINHTPSQFAVVNLFTDIRQRCDGAVKVMMYG